MDLTVVQGRDLLTAHHESLGQSVWSNLTRCDVHMAQTTILIKIQIRLVVTLWLPQPPQPGNRTTDQHQTAGTEHPQRAECCF